MKIRSHTFLGIYILFVLLDVVVASIALQELRQLTKPLILISLILFFVIKGRNLSKKIYGYTLLALCFSLLGDLLLLYDHFSSLFFMLGLIAFLLAHINYAIVFFEQGSQSFKKDMFLTTGIFLAYGATLFLILRDNLGPLKIPVIIYILGILTLAISAYSRKHSVNHISFKLVFIGALFFILSDSILAVNKFVVDIPWSHVLVMGTYATAQYLMVRGLLTILD